MNSAGLTPRADIRAASSRDDPAESPLALLSSSAPSGWAVQPAKCTRRVATSMKNSTYNRRNQTVSTVKKSTAMRLFACDCRNWRHDGPDRPPRWTQVFLAEHVPDGGCRHHDAESFQFPDDALITPWRILAHERRRIIHVAVTDHPTATWTAQQLREAFPWDEAPRYLVRDRDSAFSAWTTTAAAIGIEQILTAPRSPWQNAYAERLIGSIRRECLDHLVIANERGLRHVLAAYIEYYLKSRTHLSLNKDAPVSRPAAPPTAGRIVAIRHLGGLHHQYERRAA
jgi:transposase InsO family protein